MIATSIEVGSLDGATQTAIMAAYLSALDCGGIVNPGISFIRGDVNNDGATVALIDALALLNFGFNGGAAPPCFAQADINGDRGVVALIDALALLNFGFNGGPPPPPPGTSCGVDANSTDTLGCDTPNPSCP